MNSDPADLAVRLRASALSGDMPLGQAFDAISIAEALERLIVNRDKWKACAEMYERGTFDSGDQLIDEARRG